MTATTAQRQYNGRSPVPREVGRRLRDLRQGRRLSLVEVAARVGTTHQHLSRIEHGKVNTPIVILAQLAHALDTPLCDLFHSTACAMGEAPARLAV